MPFVSKYIRGRLNLSDIGPTIPQIYYQSTLNFWKQIISDDLYSFLLEQELPWTLLPSGDFLIQTSSAFSIVNNSIADFYELPPPAVCSGISLLLTINKSIRIDLSSIVSCSLTTTIIPKCDGRSSLNTIVGSVNQLLDSSINSNLSTEVL